jgi:vacuolar-type H+-ATPase subunit H
MSWSWPASNRSTPVFSRHFPELTWGPLDIPFSRFIFIKTIIDHCRFQGLSVPGNQLIANLAELDQKLTDQVEETRREADEKIRRARAESQRLKAEADQKVSKMQEAARERIAEETAKIKQEARSRAEKEQERLRSEARPQLDGAVKFVLSKVMP